MAARRTKAKKKRILPPVSRRPTCATTTTKGDLKTGKVSELRQRLTDEAGKNWTRSYGDNELESAEKIREEFLKQGVELPTDWDGVRQFYATHPELSMKCCAILAYQDWRNYWTKAKAANWPADRQQYEGMLKEEVLQQVARRMGKQIAGDFERYAGELRKVAMSILKRASRDLEASDPQPYRSVVSKKDSDGVITSMERRSLAPPPYQQVALLDKYVDVISRLMGITSMRSGTMATVAADAPVVPPGEQGAPEGPIDQARRAWEAQNAMWAGELGHDYRGPTLGTAATPSADDEDEADPEGT